MIGVFQGADQSLKRQQHTQMAAAVVGTIVLQGPIGALSDRFDRRKVLAVTTGLTSIAAVLCIPAAEMSITMLFLAIGLFGGLAFPILFRIGRGLMI